MCLALAQSLSSTTLVRFPFPNAWGYQVLMELLLDCGLTHLRNDFLHSSLAQKAPDNAAEIAKMDFLEILE